MLRQRSCDGTGHAERFAELVLEQFGAGVNRNGLDPVIRADRLTDPDHRWQIERDRLAAARAGSDDRTAVVGRNG